MSTYIDGFVFPLSIEHIESYKMVAEEISKIWLEHGAISYQEFIGDQLELTGTRSFSEALELKDTETVVFGWVEFPNKDIRTKANEQIASDPRVEELVKPITQQGNLIFNSRRMLFGGFKPFIKQ